MQHFHSLTDIALTNSWLTVGVYDGVHRGHQEIINKLTAGAHANGVPAVVLTFSPDPASVLGKRKVKCLTTPEERADLLFSLGVDVVITHAFDETVAGLSAQEFMARLKRHLGISHLLMGYDFALGKGREGNAARLAELGRAMDYSVEVVEAVSDQSGVISSTEIRKLVDVGSVAEAANLLGHTYSLRGPVVHGDGRGRAIHFPTANIEYADDKLIPANGIYACRAWLGGVRHAAAVNVGVRPTFKSEATRPLVEAFILDFNADIYGQDLRLEFVARLRDELKFPSVDALVEQMQRDVAWARQLLSKTA
ncbi:MAG: bifunctional riboflavin kinase/FAD synthetase [Chloroflexi bacterium]|nr:bifunctional riboflavin kinase/FAD synthetase [Chloroflexota bacterium]